MVGRTTKPTAAQKRRMDAISRMTCVACDVLNQRQPNKTEVHHITSGGRRRGHDSVLPLCSWHHRAWLPAYPSMRLSTASEKYGPSLALNKRAFVDCFGTEIALLDRVNESLKEAANAHAG